jgi:hypothetical protein
MPTGSSLVKMNPLKRKTIWTDEKKDFDGNTLAVKIEKTQVIAPGGSSELVCSIEIATAAIDEYGRSLTKRRRFDVDQSFIEDLTLAVREFHRIQSNFTPRNGLVQIRHDGTAGFVVMLEVPPYEPGDKLSSRYVIGDGSDIRFIVGSLPDLRDLQNELQTAI